ncbi:MAG TPA: VC0807 family protein [Pseudonocardiaceae bacterium]|jgi:hypothetical protein|nr:VC0807 family protein [Pseudonocardiaceae bacterium]
MSTPVGRDNAAVDLPTMLRRIGPGALVSIVLPLLAYAVLRPRVGSDATALAIAGAIPACWTVGVLAWRRRLDPIGVFGVAGFAVSLLLLWWSGGSALAEKLGEPLLTGLLGLVCLGSLVVGQPLHLVALRVLGRRNPQLAAAARDPRRRSVSAGFTAIIGGILLAHAVALAALAIALPTTSYLALSRPVGLSVLAVGIAGLLWYRQRVRN